MCAVAVARGFYRSKENPALVIRVVNVEDYKDVRSVSIITETDAGTKGEADYVPKGFYNRILESIFIKRLHLEPILLFDEPVKAEDFVIGYYEHYKVDETTGKRPIYLADTVALRESDLMPVVVYRKKEAGATVWTRPLSSFTEKIWLAEENRAVDRFTLVGKVYTYEQEVLVRF